MQRGQLAFSEGEKAAQPITRTRVCLPLSKIVLDESVYPRKEVDHKRVEQFAALMRDGVAFDPIEVERQPAESDKYRVLDGAHRKGACREIGQAELDADVLDLGGRSAILYAAGKTKGPMGLRELEAKEVARRAYTDNPKLTSAEIAVAVGRSRQQVDEYIADLRRVLELTTDLKIMRMSRLGIPQERIGAMLGISQDAVDKHLRQMPELANSVNGSLGRGLPVREVAEKHDWPETLVWALALEGKTDHERFQALKWGLRTWDNWYWSDVDRRFGDDWPGRIPAQLVAHALYYFTKQDDLILDPMAGGGVVADTCLAFNRRCWSFEMSDRPETRPEIEPYTWEPGDLKWPVAAKAKPDLVFFDPPYFDKKEREYAEGGIAGLSRDAYLGFFSEWFALCRENTKATTRLAFLNADWRDFQGRAATEEDPAHAITMIDYAGLLEAARWQITHIIDCPLSSERFTGNVVEAMQARRTLGVVRRTLLVARRID